MGYNRGRYFSARHPGWAVADHIIAVLDEVYPRALTYYDVYRRVEKDIPQLPMTAFASAMHRLHVDGSVIRGKMSYPEHGEYSGRPNRLVMLRR